MGLIFCIKASADLICALLSPRRLDRKAARNLICGECEKLALPVNQRELRSQPCSSISTDMRACRAYLFARLAAVLPYGLRQFRTPAARRRFFADGSNASAEIARAYIRSAGVGYSRDCSSRSSLDVFDLGLVIVGTVTQD